MNETANMTDNAGSDSDPLDAELDAMRTCAAAIEPFIQDARLRILRWLIDRYGAELQSRQGAGALPGAPAIGSPPSGHIINVAQPEVTPKRFVQDKAPKTDVERITVLAYYLTHHRGKRHFNTADLSALNTEAAQPKFSNASDAASNALKSSGFLADAGKGMRQLSAKGEEAVEALPDREALKAVMSKYGSSRRRRPAKTARTKAED